MKNQVGTIAIALMVVLATGCGGDNGTANTSAAKAQPPADLKPMACQDNAFKHKFAEGEDHWLSCPEQCLWGMVHGDGTYTADSAICVAAVHAGVIGAEGGAVHVRIGGMQPAFAGTERNGVTTSEHGKFVTSFSFD
jgi:hypothetical protein